MSSQADALLAHRFRLGPKLGSGATGDVFRALDEKTGEWVAVKLASDRLSGSEAAVRYDREAAALAVLASPHVVRLVAAGRRDDDVRPFLVLELLRGRTLQEELAAHGPLPAVDVVRWLAEAARALDLAHGVGIVHRDLKPANLYLHEGEAGRLLKVLDFGLVKDLAELRSGDADVVVGTPLYMAPEQVRGQPTRIGAGTDVWALAMVAIKLLTGEHYFAGSSFEELSAEIDHAPMYAPSSRWDWLPRDFDDWFGKATQRVVERRFRSAGEAVLDLREALSRVSETSRTASLPHLGDASTIAARSPTPSLLRPHTATAESLVGRHAEQVAILAQLRRGAVVTLSGPPGVGKTRLAEVVAGIAGERFPDGAWVARIGDGDLAASIAVALELTKTGDGYSIEQVIAALAPRELLLVLDGWTGGVEVVQRLRAACPGVAWLVTGRSRVGLEGEQVVALEPLELPPPGVGAVEASRYAAVELFAQRAFAAAPTFNLDERSVDDVIAICRQVDGLPLALELAAAQAGERSLSDIRARLSVVGEERDPVRAVVSGAYGVLDAEVKLLLQQLAVSPAGLLAGEVRWRYPHLERVEDGLIALREVGLLGWTSSEPARLRVPDSVRDFCLAEARAAGVEALLWQRALAGLETRIGSQAGAGWLELVDVEHENIEAALSWAVDKEPEIALRVAGRLAWYWYLRGRYMEGSRWLDAALAQARVNADEDRRRALHGAGRLALLSCRYRRARELLGASRDLAVLLGDRRGEADAEQLLGSVAREQGAYGAAERHHRRSLELWRGLGEGAEVLRAQNYLDFLAWLSGGTVAGDEVPVGGDREVQIWWWLNRGAAAFYGGDAERAVTALGRAFADSVAASFQEGIAWSLDLLGLCSRAAGESVQARARLRASLRVHRRLGDMWRTASVLESMAVLAMQDGLAARGAMYFGAAEALRRKIEAPLPACERPAHAESLARGFAALGEAFAVGLERGRRTPLEQILGEATEVG